MSQLVIESFFLCWIFGSWIQTKQLWHWLILYGLHHWLLKWEGNQVFTRNIPVIVFLVIKAISQSSSQLHPLSSIPQDKLPWHKVWRIWHIKHKETLYSTVKSAWILFHVTDRCCMPVSWQTLLDHLCFREYGSLVKFNSFLTGKFIQQQIKWWTFTMENIKKYEKLRYGRGQSRLV